MTIRRFAEGFPERKEPTKLDSVIAANLKELGYGG
jgi:hypothetical protein